MKRHQFIILLLVFIHAVLYFEQGYGFNTIIMAAVLTIAQLTLFDNLYRNKFWILSTTGFLISSTAVALNGNLPGIIGSFVSFAAMSVACIAPGTSVFTSILWTAISSVFSFLAALAEMIGEFVHGKNPDDKSGFQYSKILIAFFPFVLFLIFLALYRDSNVAFNNFAASIDWKILSFPALFFMFKSGIIIYGVIRFTPLLGFFGLERNFSSEANLQKEFRLIPADLLCNAGIWSLVVLNLLLITVNAIDLSFLVLGSKLPEDLTWSELVHQGIGSLIFSLVLSILILLFFIRRSVFTHSNFKWLKAMALIWIAQNLIMVFFNVMKNHLYIDAYGLTGKRIGVDLYLMLAVIGLSIATILILYRKSSMFMIRTFGWATYIVLILATTVNWNIFIAEYNIQRAITKNKSIDIPYLYELGDDVLPLLVKYNLNVEDDFYPLDGYGNNNTIYSLNRRVNNFLEEQNNISWKSNNMRDLQTADFLIKWYYEKNK